MKNLAWIVAVLVLLVLFPALPQAVAAVAAAGALWLSTQPVLVGFALGLIALPHFRRTKTAPARSGH